MSASTVASLEVVLTVPAGHRLPDRSARTTWNPTVDEVTKVRWMAHLGTKGLVLCVTAFTASHQNHSWYLTAATVADGLDTSPVPDWVPDPPDWFHPAVADLRPRTINKKGIPA